MNKRKILVVEDERLVAKHIENMVRRLGYDVTAVEATGEAAVRTALEKSPDLVLMDIMLGGKMDGITASKQIWQRAAIPVVYLTASAGSSTLVRAKAAEPFGYLLKPFEERELRSAIEMALYKHKTDARLKDRERWLASILASIEDGVISTNKDGVVTFMNSMAETLTGQKKADSVGKGLSEVFSLVGEKAGKKVALSVRKIAGKKPWLPADQDLLLLRPDSKIPVEIGATLIRDEKNAIDGTVVVFKDITERKKQEQRLSFLAIHDSLTELPNRTLFNDHLTLALANASRRKQSVVVMMLDLDRFKKVNDTLGHSVGDRLLKGVGERLLHLFRKGDTVARLGGDEFMILLPDVSDVEVVFPVAERTLKAFKKAFDLKDRKIHITASIGFAIHPSDGEDAETLTRNADKAMYAAKEAGRDTFKLFSRLPSTPEPRRRAD